MTARTRPSALWTLILPVCTLGLVVGMVLAEERQRQKGPPVLLENGVSTSNTSLAPADRLREGTTLVAQDGYFKLTGDRLTFYSADGQTRLGGLENLNLERIAKLVSESPEQLDWSINGTVTEFQGGNFILITRAVLKSRRGSTQPR